MNIARGSGQVNRTEKQSDCQQCLQPLEESEAGFCEGCGMKRAASKRRCIKCGDRVRLVSHPEYRDDFLCVDCAIAWHEAAICDAEETIVAHKNDIAELQARHDNQ